MCPLVEILYKFILICNQNCSTFYCVKWSTCVCVCVDGYISVMNVELNMKEMLELGKRASQAIGRGHGEADTLSLSSR